VEEARGRGMVRGVAVRVWGAVPVGVSFRAVPGCAAAKSKSAAGM